MDPPGPPSVGKRIAVVLRETYEQWDRDNASSLAAALAYYAVFATAPLLVLLVTILGAVVGTGNVRAEVLRQARLAIGPQGEAAVTLLLDNASRSGSSTVAVFIGAATLLVTVSGLLAELSRSLGIVWKVPPREKTSLLDVVKDRALGFVMVLAGGAFLLLSMIATSVLGAIGSSLTFLGPASQTLIALGNMVATFAGVTALFALAVKLLSRAKIAWMDVWRGALTTAVFFTLGETLIALYFARVAVASSFGAAGSLAVFLAWVYYSAQISFVGAELTQVLARHRSAHLA